MVVDEGRAGQRATEIECRLSGSLAPYDRPTHAACRSILSAGAARPTEPSAHQSGFRQCHRQPSLPSLSQPARATKPQLDTPGPGRRTPRPRVPWTASCPAVATKSAATGSTIGPSLAKGWEHAPRGEVELPGYGLAFATKRPMYRDQLRQGGPAEGRFGLRTTRYRSLVEAEDA